MADSASETNDTKIVRVDGKWVGDETFEILPGRHEIEVVGTSRRLAMGPRTALLAYLGRKSRHMVACFVARGGHSYVVRTRGSVREDGPWEVEIFDQKTTYLVHVECDDDED